MEKTLSVSVNVSERNTTGNHTGLHSVADTSGGEGSNHLPILLDLQNVIKKKRQGHYVQWRTDKVGAAISCLFYVVKTPILYSFASLIK